MEYRHPSIEARCGHARHKLRKTSSSHGLPLAARHPLATAALALALTALSLPVLVARHGTSRALRGGGGGGGWAADDDTWRSVDVVDAPDHHHHAPEIDVEVRQAWIYADGGADALGRGALSGAEGVQERLLRDILTTTTATMTTATPGDGGDDDGPASFVLSILSGLNASADGVDACQAVHARSPADLALRPLATLAAPVVVGRRVVGAGGIVVSLFYTPGSSAGEVWSRNVAGLAEDLDVVVRQPSDGTTSRIVMILARKATAWDDIAFYALYTAAAVYVTRALRGVARFRSKLAQLVAVVAQVFASTTLAFAVASVVGIDLLTVPWKAYPLIAFAQCFGNSLQFIDEIEKSSGNSRVMLISNAHKRLGTTPFINAARNAVIFLVLSSVTPLGLASFGYYAIVVVTFDLLVFSTLFVAVSSLNVRSISLEETFSGTEKSNVAQSLQNGNTKTALSHRSSPETAVSRLTAGLVIIGLFVCILAAHFIDLRSTLKFGRLLRLNREAFPGFPLRNADRLWPVADTLSWLRMQDVDTLGAIMRLAGLQSSIVVAQIHDPLAIVLEATGVNASTVDDIWTRQITAVLSDRWLWIPTAIFSIVLVTALALWEAFLSPDGGDELDMSGESTDISSVRCLSQAHTLDVFLLASDSRRFLVSVGFDREVRLWDLEFVTPSSTIIPYTPSLGVHWPITMVSIDSRAEWIAICSQDHHVAVWNRQNQSFALATTTDSRIASCVFARVPTVGKFSTITTHLLIVLENGALVDINIDTAQVIQAKLCNSKVLSAHIGSSPRMPARLIILTEQDGIFISVNRDGWWSTRPLPLASLNLTSPTSGQGLRFSVIPSLKGVGMAYNEEKSDLHLLDLFTGVQIYSFHPRPLKFSTLRAFHSPPQSCVYCGSTAVASFSIAYTEKGDGGDGDLVMTTVSAEHNPEPYRTGLICLRSERDVRERRCHGFVRAAEAVHVVPDPGVWEATGANGVAGVRRREAATASSSGCASSTTATTGGTAFRLPVHTGENGGRLAHRKAARHSSSPSHSSQTAAEQGDRWEAWTMTARGVRSRHSLTTGLLASKPGPACRVARNAVAVGLADVVVLVQFGPQLLDNDDLEGAGGGAGLPAHGRLSRQGSRRFGT